MATQTGTEAMTASTTTLEALEKVSALQNAGKLKQAFELCREIIATDPKSADAYNIGGVIAFRGGNKALALKMLRQAVAVSPDHAGAHNNLGIVFKETGSFDEAVATFERSLELNADDADTHFNLGNALHLSGHREQAADAYGRAVALRPDFTDAAYNQAMMFVRLGRFAEAAEVFERVVALRPDFTQAQFEFAKALYKSGQPQAANQAFERVLGFDMTTREIFFQKAVATMHTRGAQALIDFCDTRLSEDAGDPVALSTKAIALYETGESDAGRTLTDYERFVQPVRLSAPDGFDSMDAFNAALVDHVRHHPSLEYEPQTQATRFGKHTGNLNQEPRGPIAAFEAAIVEAANAYASDIRTGSPHPFFDTIPARSHQIIWSIIMHSQGHQVPHIHPEAWLSGVYYPKLPSVIDAPDRGKEGWIEFGEPPEDFACSKPVEVKIFKPEEGLLFLFPSYFYHRTIPFESDEERVSVAFDFIADE